jgi:hypothetical protein
MTYSCHSYVALKQGTGCFISCGRAASRMGEGLTAPHRKAARFTECYTGPRKLDFVNTVLNILVGWKAGSFLIMWVNISFLRRTRLPVVCLFVIWVYTAPHTMWAFTQFSCAAQGTLSEHLGTVSNNHLKLFDELKNGINGKKQRVRKHLFRIQ